MKLDLVVERPKKKAGRIIPITRSPYVIGRDEQCQLRPDKATVSKKHCAVLVRGERVFVRDLQSTNGTFLNQERIQEERELRDGDRLQIAGLELRIVLHGSGRGEPPGTADPPAASADEAAAAALLLAAEEGGPATGAVDEATDVPTGSTATLPPDDSHAGPEQSQGASSPVKPAPPPAASEEEKDSVSSAAQEILKRYRKPPSPS
jgi:predicted component of type VI protein secretion system